eukprot:TRINITY_DN1531_c0_g1_i5.p1 TRINITY_DN1531_c0_g1~~TRINITY_DN1531_c0_g1_i5.p1  ORF type:complete len:407 (-),score=91.03 TRINITY_DN1531_c0_g1_i5:477-1697(-)
MAALPLKLGMACIHSISSSLFSEKFLHWIPDSATFAADLRRVRHGFDEEDAADVLTSFMGMSLGGSGNTWWSGNDWSRFTSQHWEVALVFVAAYLVSIPCLKWLVARYGKWDVKNFAFYWNAGLSIFSWCGVFACVPVLLRTLFTNGFYFTTCAPPKWYGDDLSGLFLGLFIYSKVAELVDTILLVLAQKPVIALQWWHHSTVLLFCWHSYSVSIATDMWFCCMNYAVHSVMYGYFAVTATKYRKMATPFAMFITLAQLLQMVVGMYVTVQAVLYQANGHKCHVNKTNSILGLLMYFSYFVLFSKLFVDNYLLKKKKASDAKNDNALHERNMNAESMPEKPSLQVDPVRKEVQQKPMKPKHFIKLVKSVSRGVSRDMSPSAGSEDSRTSSSSDDKTCERKKTKKQQ